MTVGDLIKVLQECQPLGSVVELHPPAVGITGTEFRLHLPDCTRELVRRLEDEWKGVPKCQDFVIIGDCEEDGLPG